MSIEKEYISRSSEEIKADLKLERMSDLADKIFHLCVESDCNSDNEIIAAMYSALSRFILEKEEK